MTQIVDLPMPAGGRSVRLGVVGTGYVGLTTGACFAHLGHSVVCADIDERKIDLLNAGRLPIVEEGLERVVADATAAGRLSFVLGAPAAAADAEVVFLCVPTPQGEDGSADLSYIEAAARAAHIHEFIASLPYAARTPNRIFLAHSLPGASELDLFDPRIASVETIKSHLDAFMQTVMENRSH